MIKKNNEHAAMTHLYTKFSQSLQWNIVESVVYKVLLVGHQIALFRISDPATYGLNGSIFSFIFLIITISSIGLNSSIEPFFTYITKNKQSFRSALYWNMLPNYAFLLILIGSGVAGLYTFANASILNKISPSIIAIIACIIALEATKKTFRVLLQNAFETKKAALSEMGTLTGYVCLVWISHALGAPLSLKLVLIPMLIFSLINTFLYAKFIYQFYQSLPDLPGDRLPAKMPLRMARSRFFTFLNEISHIFFSSNFLIPLFAMRFGLGQAGVFKLVGNICHGITSTMQKIFGFSGGALLSHAKKMNLATRRAAFTFITHRLNLALYGLIIFLLVNYQKVIGFSAHGGNEVNWKLITLFVIVSVSESFFIVYEKFFITQERSDYLLIFNLITMGLLFVVIQNSHNFSQLTLLVTIVGIRAFSFSLISWFSFYQWRLKPSLAIRPSYLFGFLTFSIIFFFLTP